MPEGPSVVILKEQVQHFTGKKVMAAGGNTKIETARLANKIVTGFRSWGKHFLICFKGFVIRIHFLMWGSYTINEIKDRPVRLSLTFENGEVNFYSCAVKIIEGNADDLYDFSADVMSDTWDPAKAIAKLVVLKETMVCDALLDQEIFSGVGNIIKNEVLYRIGVHPETRVQDLTEEKLKMLVDEARNYSFDFYEWKKNFELKKHWLAHTKKWCLRCDLPIIRKQTGVRNRRSFFCVKCQIRGEDGKQ